MGSLTINMADVYTVEQLMAMLDVYDQMIATFLEQNEDICNQPEFIEIFDLISKRIGIIGRAIYDKSLKIKD